MGKRRRSFNPDTEKWRKGQVEVAKRQQRQLQQLLSTPQPTSSNNDPYSQISANPQNMLQFFSGSVPHARDNGGKPSMLALLLCLSLLTSTVIADADKDATTRGFNARKNQNDEMPLEVSQIPISSFNPYPEHSPWAHSIFFPSKETYLFKIEEASGQMNQLIQQGKLKENADLLLEKYDKWINIVNMALSNYPNNEMFLVSRAEAYSKKWMLYLIELDGRLGYTYTYDEILENFELAINDLRQLMNKFSILLVEQKINIIHKELLHQITIIMAFFNNKLQTTQTTPDDLDSLFDRAYGYLVKGRLLYLQYELEPFTSNNFEDEILNYTKLAIDDYIQILMKSNRIDFINETYLDLNKLLPYISDLALKVRLNHNFKEIAESQIKDGHIFWALKSADIAMRLVNDESSQKFYRTLNDAKDEVYKFLTKHRYDTVDHIIMIELPIYFFENKKSVLSGSLKEIRKQVKLCDPSKVSSISPSEMDQSTKEINASLAQKIILPSGEIRPHPIVSQQTMELFKKRDKLNDYELYELFEDELRNNKNQNDIESALLFYLLICTEIDIHPRSLLVRIEDARAKYPESIIITSLNAYILMLLDGFTTKAYQLAAKAISLFEQQSSEQDHHIFLAYEVMAEYHLQNNNYKKAKEFYENALECAPTNELKEEYATKIQEISLKLSAAKQSSSNITLEQIPSPTYDQEGNGSFWTWKTLTIPATVITGVISIIAYFYKKDAPKISLANPDAILNSLKQFTDDCFITEWQLLGECKFRLDLHGAKRSVNKGVFIDIKDEIFSGQFENVLINREIKNWLRSALRNSLKDKAKVRIKGNNLVVEITDKNFIPQKEILLTQLVNFKTSILTSSPQYQEAKQQQDEIEQQKKQLTNEVKRPEDELKHLRDDFQTEIKNVTTELSRLLCITKTRIDEMQKFPSYSAEKMVVDKIIETAERIRSSSENYLSDLQEKSSMTDKLKLPLISDEMTDIFESIDSLKAKRATLKTEVNLYRQEKEEIVNSWYKRLAELNEHEKELYIQMTNLEKNLNEDKKNLKSEIKKIRIEMVMLKKEIGLRVKKIDESSETFKQKLYKLCTQASNYIFPLDLNEENGEIAKLAQKVINMRDIITYNIEELRKEEAYISCYRIANSELPKFDDNHLNEELQFCSEKLSEWLACKKDFEDLLVNRKQDLLDLNAELKKAQANFKGKLEQHENSANQKLAEEQLTSWEKVGEPYKREEFKDDPSTSKKRRQSLFVKINTEDAIQRYINLSEQLKKNSFFTSLNLNELKIAYKYALSGALLKMFRKITPCELKLPNRTFLVSWNLRNILMNGYETIKFADVFEFCKLIIEKNINPTEQDKGALVSRLIALKEKDFCQQVIKYQPNIEVYIKNLNRLFEDLKVLLNLKGRICDSDYYNALITIFAYIGECVQKLNRLSMNTKNLDEIKQAGHDFFGFCERIRDSMGNHVNDEYKEVIVNENELTYWANNFEDIYNSIQPILSSAHLSSLNPAP